MATEKATKAQANYRQGNDSRHCGICTMFRKPDRCTAVKGEISRDMLCDYFRKSRQRALYEE